MSIDFGQTKIGIFVEICRNACPIPPYLERWSQGNCNLCFVTTFLPSCIVCENENRRFRSKRNYYQMMRWNDRNTSNKCDRLWLMNGSAWCEHSAHHSYATHVRPIKIVFARWLNRIVVRRIWIDEKWMDTKRLLGYGVFVVVDRMDITRIIVMLCPLMILSIWQTILSWLYNEMRVFGVFVFFAFVPARLLQTNYYNKQMIVFSVNRKAFRTRCCFTQILSVIISEMH